MSRFLRGFRKVSGGIKRTRTAAVRLPDRLQAVSIKAQPLAQQLDAETTSLKPKKPRRQPKTRLGAKPEKKAKEQGGEFSAPTPAPKGGPLTTRQPRRAWHGKYDDLAPPKA
jgi:hypothetical protein